jgi:hypothetical protein
VKRSAVARSNILSDSTFLCSMGNEILLNVRIGKLTWKKFCDLQATRKNRRCNTLIIDYQVKPDIGGPPRRYY